MKLTRILNSRAVRFLRVTSGQQNVFAPDLARGLQEKFRFVEIPVTLADFDPSKGVSFRHGLFNGSVIDLFQIHEVGVVAESKAPVEVCDAFIDAATAWAAEKFNLSYEAMQPRGRAYVSELELSSEKRDIMKSLSKLSAIGEMLAETLGKYGVQCAPFQVSGVHIASDFNKEGVSAGGRLIFERRGGQPFESNIFYSQAPLRTEDHLSVLLKLEEVL